MSDFEMSIDVGVKQALAEEAKQRGVTLDELMRWVLGDWVASSSVRRFMPPAAIAPSIPTELSIAPGYMDQLAIVVRMGAAASGSLACAECTQRLTVGDVRRGHCGKCQAAID